MSNEATQHMDSALEYEKSCQSRANLFYNNRYSGLPIFRPDWETHKGLQQADIDVIIRSTTDSGWPNELKISEKFRTQPWEDVCIEIYEDFDDRRPGWGNKTAADLHFFFHEHKWTSAKTVPNGDGTNTVIEEEHDGSFVRVVPTWAIRKMWAICNDLFTMTFADMRESKMGQRKVQIGNEEVTLLIVPTKVNGKVAYVGACACVPMGVFKTMLDCDIEEQPY